MLLARISHRLIIMSSGTLNLPPGRVRLLPHRCTPQEGPGCGRSRTRPQPAVKVNPPARPKLFLAASATALLGPTPSDEGMEMRRGNCHIGTSGWSYPHWAKGRFYPRGLKQADWLRFYAEHFPSVEVNTSFYHLPRPGMFAKWRERTGLGFVFAVKLWRVITHIKRLVDCTEELRTFTAIASELGPNRGPLLVQLPPSMTADASLLDSFLGAVEEASPDDPWRVAVEFRNAGWLTQPVYDVLDRHGAALCLADLAKVPIREPSDAGFIYVRRHGFSGGYSGSYPPESIAEDAARVRGWLQEGRDVYVYYNNDVGGHAVDNARQLIAAIFQ